MTSTAPTLHPVAERGVSEDSFDAYVVAEIRAQMSRPDLRRGMVRMTQQDLADATDGLTVEAIGRKLRLESHVYLGDLVQMAEALGIEGWAILQAASMRKRLADAVTPHDPPLRDQVLEGPGGLPVIQ